MPKQKRPKPLYQRGEFKLYPREGRAHEIVWYDEQRKRERSLSAGTTDERRARIALDNEYVRKHGGISYCKECGQPLNQKGDFVAVLIANYKGTKPAKDAVHPRLDHVLLFMEATGRVEDRCDDIDEDWAGAFRAWMMGRTDRARSAGTIENSLIQLAAALNFGGVSPSFKPLSTKEVNRTPEYRASIETIAEMFRFCLDPKAETPKMKARIIKSRENLLNFLRISVATWCRPDAAHDFSTAPHRRQWFADAGVIALNPHGRRQTKKFRPTIPAARQIVPHLNAGEGPFVKVNSVRSAWDLMAEDIGLPGDGEAGMKLIRRSISTIARKRLGEEHWVQGSMMLGHYKASTSDIYALPDPSHLGRALAVTEQIIDEIEALTAGSYRKFTAHGDNVYLLGGSKNG